MGKRQRQPGKLIRQDPYEEKVDLYRWLLIVYFIIYFSMLFVAIICNNVIEVNSVPSPFDVNGLNPYVVCRLDLLSPQRRSLS